SHTRANGKIHADREPISDVLTVPYSLAEPEPAPGRGSRQSSASYHHVLPAPEAVVDWVRGTALRDPLAVLSSDGERDEFLREYTDEVRRNCRSRPDGRVLFPFLRRFVVAYR
ncbi:MAG: hypothetical protein ACRECT_01070, partial [Thermoplasmata archaeon]